MKDLVIYEKQTRIILTIITNYKEKWNRQLVLNKLLDSAIIDSNKNYILSDEENGIIKFVNPDSKVLYIDDYR